MGKPRVRHFDILVRISGPLFLLMRCFAKSLYQVWSAYSQPFLWVIQRILLISEAVSLVFCFNFIQLYTFFFVFILFLTLSCVSTQVCLLTLVFSFKLKICNQVSSIVLPSILSIPFIIINSSVMPSKLPQLIPLLQLDYMSLLCDFLIP